jgi:hypothetical protein
MFVRIGLIPIAFSILFIFVTGFFLIAAAVFPYGYFRYCMLLNRTTGCHEHIPPDESIRQAKVHGSP